MKLDDITLILQCSKPAASLLRAGKYDRPTGDLLVRYTRLAQVVQATRESQLDLYTLCRDCPRDGCEGCRVADLI